MGWHEQIFRYCERGLNPAFWAEPFNAASNLAFLVAAVAMAGRLNELPPDLPRLRRAALALMLLLVAAISVGSFLFHTLATRWAEIADVLPITGFMVLYLAFALRLWMGLGWTTIVCSLVVFLAISGLLSRIDCASLAFVVPDRVAALGIAPGTCFRGTIAYAPALCALLVMGLWIGPRQAAGRTLLIAAATFGCAMTLRRLDQDICPSTAILGAARGTHALWHLLNAVTLGLLLHAAFDAAAVSGPQR